MTAVAEQKPTMEFSYRYGGVLSNNPDIPQEFGCWATIGEAEYVVVGSFKYNEQKKVVYLPIDGRAVVLDTDAYDKTRRCDVPAGTPIPYTKQQSVKKAG